MNKIIRRLKNFIGEIKGISGCGICGDNWNWKKEHSIHYSRSNGAFPFCEECWQTKPDEELIRCTINLFDLWMAQVPYSHMEETKLHGEQMLATLKEDLKTRKCLANEETKPL